MKLVFLDSCYKTIGQAIANATVYESTDELKAQLRFKGITNVDISAVGFVDKSVCKEEIVEIWGYDNDNHIMAGKMINVKDEKAFKKSISKFAKKYEDSNPERFLAINEFIDQNF